MLQVFRLFMWPLLEQQLFPGLCHGLEALHMVLFLMSFVSFQQSRNIGLWFFREVVQRELQIR